MMLLYESYYGISDLGVSLEHHGIKGQKWGVRRFQNPDGSLTEAGKQRYFVSNGKLKPLTEKNVTAHYNERSRDWVRRAEAVDARVSELQKSNDEVKKITREHDGDGYELVEKIQSATEDKKLEELTDALNREFMDIEQERTSLMRQINDRAGLSSKARKEVIKAIKANADLDFSKLPNTSKQAKYFEERFNLYANERSGKRTSKTALTKAARDYAEELAGPKAKSKVSVRNPRFGDTKDTSEQPLDEAIYLSLMKRAEERKRN